METLTMAVKILTVNPLTWRIWWALNNASRWQMGFNSALKKLKLVVRIVTTMIQSLKFGAAFW